LCVCVCVCVCVFVFWKICAETFASLNQRTLCIHNNSMSVAKVANFSGWLKYEKFCCALVILIVPYKHRVRCRKCEVSNRIAVIRPQYRTNISDTEHWFVNQPLCLTI